MAHRHQQLEDSLRLHQFIHDKEDELRWVREREPLASSSALGNSLTTVQSLLKKHQVTYHLSSHLYVGLGSRTNQPWASDPGGVGDGTRADHQQPLCLRQDPGAKEGAAGCLVQLRGNGQSAKPDAHRLTGGTTGLSVLCYCSCLKDHCYRFAQGTRPRFSMCSYFRIQASLAATPSAE